MPAGIKLVCLVGDGDAMAGRLGCDSIFARTNYLRHRNYAWMFSDAHGDPPLRAGHFLPTSDTSDALDYLGTWRLADALIACRRTGKQCDKAFRPHPGEVPMGRWSDGVPAHPMKVDIVPPPCPLASRARGC
jgi:hypothetical protein